jgi:hypothetical protein
VFPRSAPLVRGRDARRFVARGTFCSTGSDHASVASRCSPWFTDGAADVGQRWWPPPLLLLLCELLLDELECELLLLDEPACELLPLDQLCDDDEDGGLVCTGGW